MDHRKRSGANLTIPLGFSIYIKGDVFGIRVVSDGKMIPFTEFDWIRSKYGNMPVGMVPKNPRVEHSPAGVKAEAMACARTIKGS